MAQATHAQLREGLEARLPEKAREVDGMCFGFVDDGDQVGCLKKDIAFIKESGYLKEGTLVIGCILDLDDGAVREVVA